ncbi:hypothetical protein [Agrococcus jejuensis]|nr:hypothetical protein [Agrococcus jejuensis]
MTDPLEARLRDAGRVAIDDDATEEALHAVVAEARTTRPRRRGRHLAPVIGLGAVLVLAAPVAVAATQWGPWTLEDPDLVVARDWFAVDGTPIGTCESRLETQELPDEVRADAVAYFDALDVATMDPDPEAIAAGLNSIGRLDEIGTLVAGAEPGDFDVQHQGELVDASIYPVERILQDALMQTIQTPLATQLLDEHPEALPGGFGAAFETQCTSAPTVDQP